MGIETREFAKLHRGAAHDKTPARIRSNVIPRCRWLSQVRKAIAIFENGFIGEREHVAIEPEIMGDSALRRNKKQGEPAKTCRSPALAQKHGYGLARAAVAWLSVYLPSFRNFS